MFELDPQGDICFWNSGAEKVFGYTEIEALGVNALGQTRSDLREVARPLLNGQEEERRRIARDLHDHFAQRLALLDMGLYQLRQGLPGDLEQLQSEVARLQEHTATLSLEVREISHRLHPSILQNLGLAKALQAACEEYRRTRNAPVRFEAVEEGRAIPLETATAFYRICEEALRNVQKHAGDVSVCVRLEASADNLRLLIQDAGPGFDPDAVDPGQHLGLVSMRERASLIGAVCRCVSQPGMGTIVEVSQHNLSVEYRPESAVTCFSPSHEF